VPSCWVLVGGGELGSGKSVAARGRTAAVVGGESGSLCSAVCVVYSPYLYRCCSCSLCLLFCETAFILTHEFFACFFPFPSTPRRGEGRPCGAFVASRG